MRIFMTGGAGFLGRAIMRRTAEVIPDEDVQYTIYSRDAAKHTRARHEFPQANFIMGDVRDAELLEAAMAGHDVVVHAGAMKYVPEGERNVREAVEVNVAGSENVVTAALRTGIQRVVGISTDKACRPVNVYGITKLLMERLFQEADGVTSNCQFNLVRYGNVVSSTGSVIPLFRRQAREGTITLTNPEMTRFWLRIEEAVDLIWRALEEPAGGTILIPRCRSLTMAAVATACAILEVGEEHEGDVARTIIGQRFGEKIHEELLTPVETVYAEHLGHHHGKDDTMRMYPVTGGMRYGHVAKAYSSDTPDQPLSTDEMVEWIREAPGE